MKNKSVSDFVAATMDAVLNSREHKALFSGHYKYAQDMNDAKKGKKEVCPECNKVMDNNMMDSCSCGDKSYAMDDEVFADDTDMSMYSDDMGMSMDSDDMGMSMDSDDVEDYSMDMDGMHSTAAFDVAIDGLLTASAALDAVGMSNSSTVSLKLASLIVEAKKVKKEEEAASKKKKPVKGKEMAKSNGKSSASTSKSTGSTAKKKV